MLEPDDYYFNDEGLLVFTASYHLKRGFCCKNSCKHCPWKFGRKKNTDSQKKTDLEN